jgi:PKD repeat protein
VTAGSTYRLATRVNGQSGYPFVTGSALNYGTNYMVILEADMITGNANDVSKLYVNPTSSDITIQTPYATATYSSGTVADPGSLGAIDLSQFTSSSIAQSGVQIRKLAVCDNFATVYNELLGAQPPVASFTASPTNGTEPLAVTFTDSSIGTSPLSLSWNLGDSTTNTAGGASFMHMYPAGLYSVTLTASNSAGTSTIVSSNLITVLTAFQAWQVQYFGSTTNTAAAPNVDSDGDGMSNMQEFLAGTDPTNSASVFGITSILEQGIDIAITWTTGTGKTNALQFATGDLTGSYTNNYSDLFIVTNAVGTSTNYLDAGAATNFPSRYYRVRVVP